MPTLDDNKKTWDGIYDWSKLGDEWSESWGGPIMQWYGTILPRIHHFLPTGNVLEIACGYGRWTHFLKDLCKTLEVLDLSDECIQACRKRFSDSVNIKYHLNDGKSLEMISDASIDFIFTFDSLVHADETVLKAYISQFPRILTEDGAAFIHHSNLAEYYPLYKNIRKIPGLERLLKRLGLLEKSLHGRDFGVSAGIVESFAQAYGLKCISQEVLTWGTKRTHIDCFSILVKSTSSLARTKHFRRNNSFNQEVHNLFELSKLYTIKGPTGSSV